MGECEVRRIVVVVVVTVVILGLGCNRLGCPKWHTIPFKQPSPKTAKRGRFVGGDGVGETVGLGGVLWVRGTFLTAPHFSSNHFRTSPDFSSRSSPPTHTTFEAIAFCQGKGSEG